MVDSNILIDLGNGLSRAQRLGELFNLGLELLAPDPVLDELVLPDRNTLEQMGLMRKVLSVEALNKVKSLQFMHSTLSLADLSALVAAMEESAALLTGDRQLRQLAKEKEVAVHGLLWLLDEMETREDIDGQRLSRALHRIMDAGSRLPENETRKRLARWERR